MTPGDARTPVEAIREGYADHVRRYPGPHECDWYGCQTVGVLLAALADLERRLGEAEKRSRRSPVPWTRHECDLCQEPLEGRTWEWVDEGWSLACTPCLTKIRGAAERDLEGARAALRAILVDADDVQWHDATFRVRAGRAAEKALRGASQP